MPKKVIKYKFKPPTKRIEASLDELKKHKLSKAVVSDVLKGKRMEVIAEERRIPIGEVLQLYKATVDRWAGELGSTATQARELDIKRLDALLERLHPLCFPEPAFNEESGCIVTPPPDFAAAKMFMDIISQRAKLIGTEAAHKLETEKFETLRREYVGVPMNEKGVIDL